MSRPYNTQKRWDKPNKTFKRIKQRQRRAKEQEAMRQGREPEKWRKTDTWDWN